MHPRRASALPRRLRLIVPSCSNNSAPCTGTECSLTTSTPPPQLDSSARRDRGGCAQHAVRPLHVLYVFAIRESVLRENALPQALRRL